VLIPLAGAAFISVGRHPLAGLALAFAAVASVFLVNIMIVPSTASWSASPTTPFTCSTPASRSTWHRTCGSRSLRWSS